jgi:hypothetical protein
MLNEELSRELLIEGSTIEVDVASIELADLLADLVTADVLLSTEVDLVTGQPLSEAGLVGATKDEVLLAKQFVAPSAHFVVFEYMVVHLRLVGVQTQLVGYCELMETEGSEIGVVESLKREEVVESEAGVEVTGQTVVETAIVEVTTLVNPDSAGQLGVSGGQLIMVETWVVYTVLVV